ncbi:MAG: DNA polymerase III subunit delta [Treponema sp.]|nr:DNA polymerase III subunit delta [Treponema sp.]
MALTAINAYIFLGPELGKKLDALNNIRKKFKGAEETVFYIGENPVNIIADIIQNISLFSDTRIIIIKNAELVKKKDEAELIASCIKNLDAGTALVLLSDEIKLAAGLEDACLKAGMPKTNHQIFYEMFENEKSEWVRQFFRRSNYSIEQDCIDTILELVENNTDALRRECARLIHFAGAAGQKNSLSPGEAEKWLSHNREESAFTLFSRIASCDLSKALESLGAMLAAKQSAQSILAGLAWCFRKLCDYLSLLETGDSYQPDSFELKKIGLSSPKAKSDYAMAARHYNMESAEACLALTAEYDMLLRSPAAIMENILMDRYILKIIRSAANKRL